MQATACLELVHGDDPERCYGEGGGRGVHVWERMSELKILKKKKKTDNCRRRNGLRGVRVKDLKRHKLSVVK